MYVVGLCTVIYAFRCTCLTLPYSGDYSTRPSLDPSTESVIFELYFSDNLVLGI
jgi:hypothetical protein